MYIKVFKCIYMYTKIFLFFFLMVNWQHFKNWQDNNSHKTDLFEIHTQIMYPILLSTWSDGGEGVVVYQYIGSLFSLLAFMPMWLVVE